MSEIKALLLLELRSFYGINKFLHTKDLKYKKRYRSLGIIWVLLIGMIFTYVGGLVFGLCSFGLSNIVPAYLTMISSAFIVFFGLFSVGNRIFGQKGYDILASMPMKSSSIVISRFMGHYIADLILAIAIMLPGIAVYGYCEKPNILFFLFAVIGTMFIPAIPLVISTLFGTLITALASRMKNKSMMQSVLMVFLVVGIMLGSFSMEGISNSYTPEQFLNLAKTIGNIIGKIYIPAIWLNSAMVQYNILSLLIFILVSAFTVVLTVYFVSKNFNSILRRMLNFTAKHNYKISRMEKRGILKALYFRELKRYFSSSIYVTNTIIGPVLGTVMSVALCIVGVDTILKSLPIEINLPNILPFVFSAIFCMMTTTSVSISMEGKQFWVMKSLPITSKTLFDSKILLNLSLMLPFFAVSQVAFAIAVKPSILELLWMILIPMLLMLFVTVFGITVNLKFHSFDWEKEETVVKQSLSAALGGFAGFFLSIILGLATFLIPYQYSNIVKIIICLILAFSTILLYNRNNKIKLESF